MSEPTAPMTLSASIERLLTHALRRGEEVQGDVLRGLLAFALNVRYVRGLKVKLSDDRTLVRYREGEWNEEHSHEGQYYGGPHFDYPDRWRDAKPARFVQWAWPLLVPSALRDEPCDTWLTDIVRRINSRRDYSAYADAWGGHSNRDWKERGEAVRARAEERGWSRKDPRVQACATWLAEHWREVEDTGLTHRIVYGYDLRDAYDDRDYGSSCMTEGRGPNLYVENPDRVGIMLIEEEGGTPVGRALVWQLDPHRPGDAPRTYLDRVYPSDNGPHTLYAREVAKKEGWLHKRRDDMTTGHGCIVDPQNPDDEGNPTTYPHAAVVTLVPTAPRPNDADWPYCDTFRYAKAVWDEDGQMTAVFVSNHDRAPVFGSEGYDAMLEDTCGGASFDAPTRCDGCGERSRSVEHFAYIPWDVSEAATEEDPAHRRSLVYENFCEDCRASYEPACIDEGASFYGSARTSREYVPEEHTEHCPIERSDYHRSLMRDVTDGAYASQRVSREHVVALADSQGRTNRTATDQDRTRYLDHGDVCEEGLYLDEDLVRIPEGHFPPGHVFHTLNGERVPIGSDPEREAFDGPLFAYMADTSAIGGDGAASDASLVSESTPLPS